MSDLGWNIWGVVGGVIGTILAVVPLFLVWLRVRLPSKKLPSLLAVLEDTKELFAKAVRAGALADVQEIQQIEFSIATASVHVDEFRATVYAATSYWQNVKNWWNGLSSRMVDLYEALNVVRVRLVKLNSCERKMLKELDAGYSSCPDVPDHTLLPPPEYTSEPPVTHLSPPPSTGIEDQPPLRSTSPGPSLASLLRNADIPGDALEETLPSCSRPTYHVVSDPDLQSLLSLAAAQLLLRHEQRKRQRTQDQDSHRPSRQARGPGSASFPGRRARRTRGGALARLVRHAYGVQHVDVNGGAQNADIDPESLELLPQGEADDGEWQDE
ncbi:uncharacterized protein TRAVEDRAFT_66720 [Trametes versicolor FP-101664 SS1]|uniref:uncharacterized protein n=1 Tax=Trametes versicolor (strain FP-101664) TaxID=717944 RepID=UPI0004624946|nr:uncharacterized protein TRAVEDRAFT_66720 [Trametes versicolor FP-101664 SS1]EIW54130.1 hypothetical protein TRAVEDRAFT_66720 [Trametes versicolor FP-101664 SS1]